MTIGEKFFAAVAAAGTFFSAIFYVLFQLSKDQKKAEAEENKKLEEQLQSQKEKAKMQDAIDNLYNERKKNDEEKLNEAITGSTVDNFNAGVDLLHNIAERSQNRNSISSS